MNFVPGGTPVFEADGNVGGGVGGTVLTGRGVVRTAALVGTEVWTAKGDGVRIGSVVGDAVGVAGLGVSVGVPVATTWVLAVFAGLSIPEATNGRATTATVTIPISAWLTGDGNHHRRRSTSGIA